MQKVFTISTVNNAALKMRMGIKPEYHVSDKLSDKDIEQAWRKASMKVFGGGRNNKEENIMQESVLRKAIREAMNEPVYRVSDKLSIEEIEAAWREACVRVGKFVMPEIKVKGGINNLHFDVYEQLVKDSSDVIGQVAYGVYKENKREFINKHKEKLGVAEIPEEIMEEFAASQTDFIIELYRKHADSIVKEFVRVAYEEELQEEERKYQKQLAGIVKQNSFWYGVLQGVVASFLFVFASYVLLKMNGSWDLLLNNLLK